MSVSVTLGHSSDGYLESSSTAYASALSGSNVLVAGSSAPLMYYGQSLGAGVRYVWQSFVRFSWTADPDSTPVAAYLALQPGSTAGTGVSRDLEVRAYNWGTSLSSGNWRTPAQLNSAPLRGRIIGAHRAGSSQMRPGIDPATIPASSGQLHYVLASSRNRLQQAPSGLEWQTLRQAESSNAVAQRPALYVASLTKHMLDVSLGAQVQLSDGTHMLLVQTAVAGGEVGLDLVHHDGVTATTVFSGAEVQGRVGAQAYAMCRDENDNVYVLNRSGVLSRMNARAYIKGSGYTWSPGAIVPCALPSYDGHINQVAAAWHPQGGNAGTIVAVACCEAGSNSGAQATYALVNVDHLLGGGGSALRGSGSAVGTVIAAQAAPGFNNPTNEVGTLLDVTAVRDAGGQVSNRGYVLSAGQHQILGGRNAQSTGRYQLNASGTAITTARTVHTVSGFSVKDPDAKSRILPISRTQFATVNASDNSAFGIVIKHHQQSSGSSFDVLADVRLAAEGIPSMPPPGVVATSSAWDAIYDPATHWIWVYYLDASSRRLFKTHVDMATGLAAADEVLVAEDIGNSGSENLAIRVHRGETSGQDVLISVANLTSGGADSLILVSEQVNQPPDVPRRLPRANFDATEPQTFEWEFRDPNPRDHQSAYQLQIVDDGTDTLVVDTDKVLSGDEFHELAGGSLDNGEQFRWRVRTWDSFDEQSPWSPFGFFSTSASGNVTITFPAEDNPEGLETADVQIVWEVTGAVQDHYRVRVFDTATGQQLSDTGWVESVSTTHLVQGLVSEREHRIEVTARAAMVESSTGTRLVTPDYSQPIEPVITVVPVDQGAHIRIEIDNPPPGTDLSQLDGSFEAGIDGWVASPPVQVVGTSGVLGFGNSSTVNVPAGTSDGDLLLWWAGSNFDETLTPPANWVEQQHELFGSTGTDQHGVWLLTSTAEDEPSSYTLDWGGTQWHSAAGIAVRHAAGFNSWRITSVDFGTELDFPTIGVQVGDVVLYLAFSAESGTRTVIPLLVADVDADRGVWVGHELQTETGTTTSRTLTLDGNAHGMATAVLRLDQAVQLAQDDTHAHGGTYSARLEVHGTPDRAGMRPRPEHRVEVEEHHRYTVAYWIYSESGQDGVSAGIDWFDEDGQPVGSYQAPEVTVPAQEWTLIQVSASAPQGAVWAAYGPDLSSPDDETVVWVDNVELRTATDIPTPIANQVWRSANGAPPVLVATIAPGDSHRDYLTGSGRDYTYTARAVAPDGAHAESDPATGQVYFLGVWIHDPIDAEETIDQYLYGKAQRSHSVAVAQAQHHFVGRTHPVTTHGEQQTDTWQLTINVAEGPDRIAVTDRLQAWAEARRALVVRDNRGRVWISTLDGFSVADQDWGDQVAFAATRVSSDLPGSVR